MVIRRNSNLEPPTAPVISRHVSVSFLGFALFVTAGRPISFSRVLASAEAKSLHPSKSTANAHEQALTMEAAGKKKSSSKDKKKSKSQDKKSGIRTKFLIESLRNDYYSLREENERLRNLVTANLATEQAEAVLASCFDMNAPRAKVDNIDSLAEKMAGSELDDNEEDDEDDEE
jgi:hypothetical protein